VDDEGREFVVAHISDNNKFVNSKYSSCERECHIVIWDIVAYFKCYLYNNPFIFVTYHQAYMMGIYVTKFKLPSDALVCNHITKSHNKCNLCLNFHVLIL
jgi:hypothetical protein